MEGERLIVDDLDISMEEPTLEGFDVWVWVWVDEFAGELVDDLLWGLADRSAPLTGSSRWSTRTARCSTSAPCCRGRTSRRCSGKRCATRAGRRRSGRAAAFGELGSRVAAAEGIDEAGHPDHEVLHLRTRLP